MKELIKIERIDGELYADSRMVANVLGIVHQNIRELVSDKIDVLGKVRFETGAKIGSKTGQVEKYALLTERQCLLMITMVRNSDEALRAKSALVDAFMAMREMLSVKTPQSFAEALRLAADQQEAIERMAPKEIAYDKFMSAENYQQLGDVAKVLGYGRNTFFGMLRDDNILRKNNTPYQEYMQYFKVIEKPVNIGGHVENKLVVTVNASGVDYLTKRYGVK